MISGDSIKVVLWFVLGAALLAAALGSLIWSLSGAINSLPVIVAVAIAEVTNYALSIFSLCSM